MQGAQQSTELECLPTFLSSMETSVLWRLIICNISALWINHNSSKQSAQHIFFTL